MKKKEIWINESKTKLVLPRILIFVGTYEATTLKSALKSLYTHVHL